MPSKDQRLQPFGLCFLSETARAPATRLVLNLCDGGHFFQGLGLINFVDASQWRIYLLFIT
jgi:hypothetical protein